MTLNLRKTAPNKGKPNLLWIWVYLKWPREDGLSDSSEFESLKAIEEKLTESPARNFDGLLCGRITTDGRTEFYYYAQRSQGLEAAVEDTMSQFGDYEFDCGYQTDPQWKQYLEVLYPSDEQRQCMENRKVLDVLEEKGGRLALDLFRTERDRVEFLSEVLPLEYRVESQPPGKPGDFPFGICIVRFQSVNPSEIDDAIVELFRLAKKHRGDYDGWETQVIPK